MVLALLPNRQWPPFFAIGKLLHLRLLYRSWERWTHAPTFLKFAPPRRVVLLPVPIIKGWDRPVYLAWCECSAHFYSMNTTVDKLTELLLLFSALIAVAAYFIGGCAYQRHVMHQRGWKQCPNYVLWSGMFSFLKVSNLVSIISRKSSATTTTGWKESGNSKLPYSRTDWCMLFFSFFFFFFFRDLVFLFNMNDKSGVSFWADRIYFSEIMADGWTGNDHLE